MNQFTIIEIRRTEGLIFYYSLMVTYGLIELKNPASKEAICDGAFYQCRLILARFQHCFNTMIRNLLMVLKQKLELH
jgi:hypothetical protein